MAEDKIEIRDANRATIGVLTDTVTSRNGESVEDGFEAQVVKIARGTTNGVADDIGPDSPLEVQDNSPPFVQLAKGGEDLTAGDPFTIPANAAREILDVMCMQDDALTPRAYIWLDLGGGTPQEGDGDFLRPDTIFSQFTKAACAVVASADCRVTWVEWGKG